MDIDLVISGLCVLVFKSQEGPRPKKPQGIEVLCVHGKGHRPRLSYPPEEAVDNSLMADLIIAPDGTKIASLSLAGKVGTLRFGNDHRPYSLKWGEEVPRPDPKTCTEDCMNWVPSTSEIGVDKIHLGKTNRDLPKGASSRLILPPGEIRVRKVVKDPDGSALLWKFPAKPGLERAIANDVKFSAKDIDKATFDWGRGRILEFQTSGTLKVSIGTDMVKVHSDFGEAVQALTHLKFIKELAIGTPKIQVPVLDNPASTGHPICDQLHYVDMRNDDDL
jgi:hypothetical protein